MRVVVYPGTFDPVTLGHEDILKRAAQLFDQVLVGVAVAHHKQTRFTLEQRMAMVTTAMADVPGVRVLPFDGLIMDFCLKHSASAVIRGVRNLTDYDFEAQMAAMNRKLAPTIDTVILLPQPDLQCISSTLVREISKLGGDVSGMVSPAIAQALKG